MATHTTIADGSVDAESPITESLMTALRDNPTAIAEGASGAPRIQTAAVEDNAITQDKIADDSVGSDELSTVLGTDSTIVLTFVEYGATTLTQVVPAGYYMAANTVTQNGMTSTVQIYSGGGWRNSDSGLIISDGTNVRFQATAGYNDPGYASVVATLYLKKIT